MGKINNYVMEAFGKLDSAEMWGKHGLYNLETNKGFLNYNNKIYRMEYVLEYVPKAKSKNSKILDLGCGGGVFLPILKNKGYKLTGVDISLEMIKLSKEICKSTNTTASLSIGDCNKLKFDDNSYDVVIAVGLIEHQKTDFAMIKEIQRILKPGGIFILTIRNYFSPYVRFRSIVSEILRFLKNTRRVLYKKEKYKRGEDGYTRKWNSREHNPLSFFKLLRTNGFESISSRYSHFYFLPYPLNHKFPKTEALFAKPLEILSKTPLKYLASTGVICAIKKDNL